MRIAIEPQRYGGDRVKFDRGQIEAAMPSHAGDAFADDGQSVLGQINQRRPCSGNGILAQAGSARGNA